MKYLKYLFTLFVALNFWGCNDYLDIVPDNIATIDNAFVDKYTAEKYLFTCYSYMPSIGNPGKNFAFTAGDENLMPSDDVRAYWEGDLGGALYGQDIQNGYQNVSKPFYDYWNGERNGKDLWKGIRTCNILIERIHEVKDLEDFEKSRWIAEAKFLKAFYHFYLLRMYGSIPIIDTNLPVSSSPDEVKVTREPFDDCIQYIINTLDDSMTDLPETIIDEGLELGRITKVIAASVKAKVLVMAASPFFNGNSNLTLKDHDGRELFPLQFDQEKWVKANEACKVAIEMAHAAGNSLYYFTPSKQMNDSTAWKMNIRNSVCERWNSEVVWGATNSDGRTLQRVGIPTWFSKMTDRHSQMKGVYSPPMRIAEQFYSKNGVPIEEDVDYDYQNRFNLTTVGNDHRYYLKKGHRSPILHLNREPRFYAALTFDGATWYGNGFYNDEDPHVLECKSGDVAHRGRVYTGYLIKKMVHYENSYSDNNSSSIQFYPFPIIRLSDLYLLYAETLNEVKSAPDEEVYSWINQVRERAHIPSVQDAWSQFSKFPTKHTTKEGMRAIIHRERLIELTGEAKRFWDIRRWKEAEVNMNSALRGWNFRGKTDEDYYQVLKLANVKFTQKDYLWPIPESNLIKNTKLVQNPGW
ncbi:RagB/SusD family nutrient uptake outer membrane protein [Prolixibacteraceae bacterium JC049]|nr:RagB/SusD family nutrient uptake outer membrane protein [Prolixibacteraceae bacterium JC049]